RQSDVGDAVRLPCIPVAGPGAGSPRSSSAPKDSHAWILVTERAPARRAGTPPPAPPAPANGCRPAGAGSESKRALLGPAALFVDLSNGAEVIGEVRDAADHPAQLDIRHLARHFQR